MPVYVRLNHFEIHSKIDQHEPLVERGRHWGKNSEEVIEALGPSL